MRPWHVVLPMLAIGLVFGAIIGLSHGVWAQDGSTGASAPVEPINTDLRSLTGPLEPARSLNRLKSDRDTIREYVPGAPLRLYVVYNIQYEEKQADGSMKRTHYSPLDLMESFDLQAGPGVTSPITGTFKQVDQHWLTVLDPGEMLLSVEPMIVGKLHERGLVVVRCDPRLGRPGDLVCVLAEHGALDEFLARTRGERTRVFQLAWEWIFPQTEGK